MSIQAESPRSSPQAIVGANLSCLSHLQSGTALPLKHWIVALERRLAS